MPSQDPLKLTFQVGGTSLITRPSHHPEGNTLELRLQPHDDLSCSHGRPLGQHEWIALLSNLEPHAERSADHIIGSLTHREPSRNQIPQKVQCLAHVAIGASSFETLIQTLSGRNRLTDLSLTLQAGTGMNLIQPGMRVHTVRWDTAKPIHIQDFQVVARFLGG